MSSDPKHKVGDMFRSRISGNVFMVVQNDFPTSLNYTLIIMPGNVDDDFQYIASADYYLDQEFTKDVTDEEKAFLLLKYESIFQEV